MYAACVSFRTIDELEAALREADYLPDRGLATALFLALALEKPVLLEGEAGVGKTEAAKALATALGARLIRLQCYEGLDVSHAVYEWNYPRQLLHIRAAQEGTVSEEELFGPEFLIRRPLLEAIDSDEPVVLLIDEIDRADEEFEAFLLEVLSDFQITIPELGTIRARRKPAVVLTSNRTRELHDALKRRALFHWIGHPAIEREVEIVMLRVPGIPERLAKEAAAFVRGLRGLDLAKPPGVAETIDWAQALAALGREEIDAEVVEQTLGSVLKYREDIETVRDETLVGLIEEARATREPLGAACKAPRSCGTSSPSAACCARSGSRSARAASPMPFAGSTPSTSRARTTSTSRSGRRSSRATTSSSSSTAPSSRGSCAGRSRRSCARSRRAASPTASRATRSSRARTATRRTTSGDAARARRLRSRAPAREGLRRDDARGVRARAPPHGRDRADAAAPHVAPALAPIRAATVLDLRRLCRTSLRTGGEPIEQPWKARKTVPRKLVVLCDISGSMDAYARALLFYLHAIVGTGAGVEAFAFGTRLTRLTPDLATRDPEAALARANEIAVDWGSGTRIGASLGEFNAIYGRRALSRGAVVVIVSDGWERDDPDLVGREMAKLARAAYAVVWVNPLKGNPEYQPLAGGMRAALPFVDRFLPGHNLRSLEELGAVLAGIERRHAA